MMPGKIGRHQLTDDDRAKLWELWKQKQSVNWVATESGHERKTVRRYQKLDDWDDRLHRIRIEVERKSDKKEVDERLRLTNMIRAVVSATFKKLYDMEGRELKETTSATLADLDRMVLLLMKLKGEPDSVVDVRVGIAVAQQTEIFVEAANKIPAEYRPIIVDAVLAGARRYAGPAGDQNQLEP